MGKKSRKSKENGAATTAADRPEAVVEPAAAASSIGKAPSSRRARRAQTRLSLNSPYNAAARDSPRTPRTPRNTRPGANRRHSALLTADHLDVPSSPQSPSMRALNAIVSFISPFSTAKRSAAFGDPDAEPSNGAKAQEDAEEEEEEDVASQLYPALPSSPRAALETTSVADDDIEEVESGPEPVEEEDVEPKDVSVTIAEEEEPAQEKEQANEEQEQQEQVLLQEEQAQEEKDLEDEAMEVQLLEEEVLEEQALAEEVQEEQELEEEVLEESVLEGEADEPTSVVEVNVVEEVDEEPNVAHEPSNGNQAHQPTLHSQHQHVETFGESSAFGQVEQQNSPRIESLHTLNGTGSRVSSPKPLSPAFSVPRLSTPSKVGFGAIANAPIDASFASSSKEPLGYQPPSSSFTFGAQDERSGSAGPALPSYPRPQHRFPSRQSQTPLAKNYELLSRFFAEKAEEEARAAAAAAAMDASTSMESMDEDVHDTSVGLTEIEVAGCMRLIEQSFAQGQGAEIERLRLDALQRGQRPSEGHRMPLDEAEIRFSHGQTPTNTGGYIRRSPSLPLGAAANETPFGRQSEGMYSRPSQSFLAPHHYSQYQQSPEDVKVNRSLAATFMSAPSSATSSNKRRHRPLYLGPGVGAKASASILRRSQQQAQTARRYNPSRSVQQHNQSENANRDDEHATAEAATKRRRLVGDGVDVPALFLQPDDGPANGSTTTSSPALSNSKRVPAVESVATTPSPIRRSATADAMLNILSAGPSIPIRTSASVAAAAAAAKSKETPAAVVPEVVNPYERGTRSARRSMAHSSSASASGMSLAAKEKERLKEERERRQKEMKEKEARKETTLEFIQRTAPSPSVRRQKGRRIRLEDDDDDVEEDDDSKRDGLPEHREEGLNERTSSKKDSTTEEERKRKNEELKRRTEALLAKSKPTDSGSQSPTKDKQSPPASSFGKPSEAPLKPLPFSTAFAPKKPSPLSQAPSNIVPDSPSGSSEASERESVAHPTPPQSNKAFRPPSAMSNTIVIDDDDDDDSNDGKQLASTSAPAAKQPLFSFGSSKSVPSVSTEPKPSPAPATTSAALQAATSTPAAASTLSPQEQARNAAASSLPKFDFALNIVLPSANDKSSADQATARKAALETPVSGLPKFDFAKSSASSTTTATSASKGSGFSGAKTNGFTTNTTVAPTPFSGFAFKPSTPAPAPAVAPPSIGASTDTAEKSTNDDTASATTEKSASALLSGSGEGEEDEESLHEVRCKVWNLQEGKWNDLGIGMLRIKKHKTTQKRRVLVRNEGNGKVTVNFSLLPTFKANIDKNVVSFLGFDQTGKPTNYRVKIKTDASAQDLKQSLDASVKELAV